ncbi:MAG: hypothetical protein ACE367_09150 [Acidimicrobiales bacterium]
MHVLWEHSAVGDPAAHDAKRRKRWMIAGAIAAVSALTVLSFGVWGLVYPAIVLVIAALAIEPLYWLRKRMPTQRIWTDGTLLGVDGAAEVIGQPLDPVPLASVAKLAVYPIAGGYSGGATVGGVSTSSRVHYSAVDLWLTDGSRRLWIFNRVTGISLDEEVALARALAIYLPDRWRDPPGDDDMGADVGEIDRRRLGEWPVG